MSELSQADQFLLDAIEAGDPSGWEQLVDRYQGRLVAFARERLRGSHQGDAEDLVQDTFLRFLQSLKNFRRDASVETYLFSILRRRIIDVYRGRGGRLCLLGDVMGANSRDNDGRDSGVLPGEGVFSGGDPMTASWYARKNEAKHRLHFVLADALKSLVERYQNEEGLRDLQILEMIFYAQLGNKEAAKQAGVRDNFVGLLKHRSLKRIQDTLLDAAAVDDDFQLPDALMTGVWEEVRPSCPKRNTIGQLMLGTLDEPWKSYVDFHVHQLGCRFCKANWDDLEQKTQSGDAAQIKQRVMESTIGLLKK